MTLFDILAFIGGLSFFLFGMNTMSEALERRSASSLKTLLHKFTKNKSMAFITGLIVTAIIQSSSATTVMTVGFVNSGVMTLKQSIGIIMGANIGTTVTAWILSLGGISDDNIILKFLKPTSFSPILAFIGIILCTFSKSNKKKDTGVILIGFAILMTGMNTMSQAVSGLADSPSFQKAFTIFKNPLAGLLVGALLTAVVQSSSASVGILQALSTTGQITYTSAIPIIMGQNIGTCITAMLSSIGANKNAKRTAVIHLLFNVIGAAISLAVFVVISTLIRPVILNNTATFAGIALVHTIFNTVCTIILLPMSSILEKLAIKLVPATNKTDINNPLDERLLNSPAIALENCGSLVIDMAIQATNALNSALEMLTDTETDKYDIIKKAEEKTDYYEDIIGSYLIKLSCNQISDSDSSTVSKYLKLIGDYERIADHSINLSESARELKEKDITFSKEATAELRIICKATGEIAELAYNTFIDNNTEIAYRIEPLEQIIDLLKNNFRDQHVIRLKDNKCCIEAGFIWSDILTDLERVADHCSNIGACIIDTQTNNMNIHSLIRMQKESEIFKSLYDYYFKKYRY